MNPSIRLEFAATAALLTVSGCVTAASVPGGPLQGVGVAAGASFGYAAAPGTATLRSTRAAGTGRVTDYAADAQNFPLLPARVGGRLGIVDWADVAGDYGFTDAGIEARAGLPEGSWPFPMAVMVGYRRGDWGLVHDPNVFHREVRARLEAYPLLGSRSGRRFHLVTALGVSVGPRYHVLSLPDRFWDGGLSEWGSTSLEFTREETRLEAALGAELRYGAATLGLVALPYAVVHGGRIEHASCYLCTRWRLSEYAAGVGAAVFLTAGLSFTFHRLRD